VRDLTPLADLRVALIQTRLAWHNPAANRAHFADLPTCRLAESSAERWFDRRSGDFYHRL
jgi:hypothetical protein